ncbi:MAG: GGDEF domain-containing protein [Planctomycetota bacterium]
MYQRAEDGAPEDLKRLRDWAALVEQEAQLLRRRSLKQQHDFNTLIEIVGQISARSLDIKAMETYLLKTVSGHFATPKLLIVRREKVEDRNLICTCFQGVSTPNLVLPVDSPISEEALTRRFSFSINELPKEAPEVQTLEELGVDLVVPLAQEVEGPGAVLEGLLLLGPRIAGHYNDEEIEFLHALGKMLAICLRNEALYRRSMFDDLTSVASRGHFDARLSHELNRIATYGHRSLGLVMLDIDDFKLVNDRHGHQSGDKVLQALARLLGQQVRTVDFVARYGGEEFTIILLEIDRSEILEVAERLCKTVAQMEVLSVLGEKLRITASFGLACYPTDALDKSTLIQLADEALYRSKALGKNRVTLVEQGAGKHRTTLGPSTSNALLLPTTANEPDPKSGVADERTPPRHRPSLSAGGFPDEVELIRERRRKLASGTSSSALLAATPPPPKPKPHRAAPGIGTAPTQDADGQENEATKGDEDGAQDEPKGGDK